MLSTPLAVSYIKLKALAWAGLINIGIGVQSIYEPVRKMYKRNESIEQIRNTSKIISQVSKDNITPITVRYDFITDNPWGGEKDTEENINFALSLENPKQVRIFSLIFYHGTELYEKAKSGNLIKDELNEVYRVTQLTPKDTYMNNVFSLLSLDCSESIVRFLIKVRSKSLVKMLKQFYKYRDRLNKHYKKAQTISNKFNSNPGEVLTKRNNV